MFNKKNKISKKVKDVPMYSRKRIFREVLPWAIIYTLTLAGFMFIVGWHSHQQHANYIDSRIDSAVQASKASE